jgi:diguanylate cyclase (GGDEF)-like protein/PAS domain S-box-containing protein
MRGGISEFEDDMEKKKVLLKNSRRSLMFLKKFEESELRYRSLLKRLPVGVYRSTPEGHVVEGNSALTAMFGYTNAELKRLDVKQMYYRKSERLAFIKKMEKSPVAMSEYQLRKKQGGAIWIRDYCRAVKGPDRKIAYFDGILVDITREKKAEDKVKKVLDKLRDSNAERQAMIRKLEDFSVTDDLTGLYNRRGFFTITKEYLNVAIRKKIQMFLLFVDMDDLKVINDTFGHYVGDEALRQLAQILLSTFRDSDIKGRMGGDEFAIFPIDSTSAGVEAATTRMVRNIAAFNESGLTPFKISVSIGVSCFDPDKPTTIEDMLILADKRMYEQKAGKQR